MTETEINFQPRTHASVLVSCQSPEILDCPLTPPPPWLNKKFDEMIEKILEKLRPAKKDFSHYVFCFASGKILQTFLQVSNE